MRSIFNLYFCLAFVFASPELHAMQVAKPEASHLLKKLVDTIHTLIKKRVETIQPASLEINPITAEKVEALAKKFITTFKLEELQILKFMRNYFIKQSLWHYCNQNH